jgi:predicted dehydrogenase
LLASDIDAVVIATPHSTHADLAVDAARAGKHVFVDKPLALTVSEADRIIENTEGPGLVLQVGHNRRRQPALRKMKAWLDQGDLGQLLHLSAVHDAPLLFNPKLPAWRRDVNENPVGGLTALGIHQVDNFNYLAGRISAVAASSKHALPGGEVDDTTAIVLEFESGVLGQIFTSPAAGPAVEVTLTATDAIVRCTQDGAELTIQTRPNETRESVTLEPLDTVTDQIAEFVSSIRGQTQPETGAVAARHAVAVLEAIVESAGSRRWVDVAP